MASQRTYNPTSEVHESILGTSPNETKLLHRLIYDSSARILFITGAGISVKSGIPLYRTDATTEIQNAMKQEVPILAAEKSSHQIVKDQKRRDSETKADGDTGTENVDSNPEQTGEPVEEPYVDISDDENRMAKETSSPKAPPSPPQSPAAGVSSTVDELLVVDEELFSKDHTERAIWDAKLEALCTRQAFLFSPKDWYTHFWFDTHHVDAFLKAIPNETHIAIGLLCSKFSDRIHCITQNVDNLHFRGGCPRDNLIEIHGRIGVYRCSNFQCPNSSLNPLTWEDLEFMTDAEEELYTRRSEYFMSMGGIISRIYSAEKKKKASNKLTNPTNADFKLPCCPSCREPAIPMTLMFDEEYTTHDFFQFSKASKWIEQSDVVVFCGTSFSVYFTERAVGMARDGSKLVFNVNIRKDDSEFYGFKSCLEDGLNSSRRQSSFSSSLLRIRDKATDTLTSSSISDKRKIELDGNLLERRQIQLEFDSNSENGDNVPPVYKAVDVEPNLETLSPMPKSIIPNDLNLSPEFYLNKKIPCVFHIVMPADQAFVAILSENYRKEILLRLKKQNDQLHRAKFKAAESFC